MKSTRDQIRSVAAACYGAYPRRAAVAHIIEVLRDGDEQAIGESIFRYLVGDGTQAVHAAAELGLDGWPDCDCECDADGQCGAPAVALDEGHDVCADCRAYRLDADGAVICGRAEVAQ